jgi:hypothetical protein
LGLASGGLSVVRELYYLISGVQPPRNALFIFIEVCAILAAWGLWYKERRLRLEIQHPDIQEPANVQPVSATNIRAQLFGGRYLPYGNDYAAVCTLHNCEGSPKLKNVRVRITIIRQRDNFSVLDVSEGCWINETKPNIEFKAGTSRDVVVAHWAFKQPVSVPKFDGRDIERKEITETEIMLVTVTLHDGTGNAISSHYYTMVVLRDDGLAHVGFQLKRDY